MKKFLLFLAFFTIAHVHSAQMVTASIGLIGHGWKGEDRIVHVTIYPRVPFDQAERLLLETAKKEYRNCIIQGIRTEYGKSNWITCIIKKNSAPYRLQHQLALKRKLLKRLGRP